MKKLTIMRGLPGSGKSFEAKKLNADVICSADDFFMVGGEYRFDPSKLIAAHAECQIKCLWAMHAGCDVVVDNTNITRAEFALYLGMAEVFGYTVEICSMHNVAIPRATVLMCAERNVHGVPLEVLEKMAARWEE